MINKNLNESVTGNFSISGHYALTAGKVWRLLRYTSQIVPLDDITEFSDHSFSYALPGGSITHFVLSTSNTLAVPPAPTNPQKYYLRSFPNPFNPSCRIEYSTREFANARIDIIAITGALVKSYRGLAREGTISWDGSNDAGQKVASGMYVAVLRNESSIIMRQKLMLLK